MDWMNSFSRIRFAKRLVLLVILVVVPTLIVYLLQSNLLHTVGRESSTAEIPACIQTIGIDPSNLPAQLYTSIDENVGSLQSVKAYQMSMRKCFKISLSKEEQQELEHSSLANEIRQFKEKVLKRTSEIKGLNLMEQVLYQPINAECIFPCLSIGLVNFKF